MRGSRAYLRWQLGIGCRAPQVGGQSRKRQPAPVGAGDTLDLNLVAGQLIEEPGRPLLAVLRADGSHDELAPRSRHRDVEQPAFLGQQPCGRCRGRCGCLPAWCGADGLPAGHHVDKLVHTEQ